MTASNKPPRSPRQAKNTSKPTTPKVEPTPIDPNAVDPVIANLLPKTSTIADLASDEEIGEVSKLTEVEQKFLTRHGLTPDNYSKPISLIHSNLTRYEGLMAGNVVIHSANQGADNQMIMFNAFMRALSLQGDELFQGIDLVLLHLSELRSTVYSDVMVYRYVQNITRGEEEVNTYLKLLEIFLIISNPVERGNLIASGRIREAVGLIPARYREASAALITYLSQQQ